MLRSANNIHNNIWILNKFEWKNQNRKGERERKSGGRGLFVEIWFLNMDIGQCGGYLWKTSRKAKAKANGVWVIDSQWADNGALFVHLTVFQRIDEKKRSGSPPLRIIPCHDTKRGRTDVTSRDWHLWRWNHPTISSADYQRRKREEKKRKGNTPRMLLLL